MVQLVECSGDDDGDRKNKQLAAVHAAVRVRHQGSLFMFGKVWLLLFLPPR